VSWWPRTRSSSRADGLRVTRSRDLGEADDVSRAHAHACLVLTLICASLACAPGERATPLAVGATLALRGPAMLTLTTTAPVRVEVETASAGLSLVLWDAARTSSVVVDRTRSTRGTEYVHTAGEPGVLEVRARGPEHRTRHPQHRGRGGRRARRGPRRRRLARAVSRSPARGARGLRGGGGAVAHHRRSARAGGGAARGGASRPAARATTRAHVARWTPPRRCCGASAMTTSRPACSWRRATWPTPPTTRRAPSSTPRGRARWPWPATTRSCWRSPTPARPRSGWSATTPRRP
jgi:hypothetical protein